MTSAVAGHSPSTPMEYVMTLSCPDRAGIVHAVTGFLFLNGCNIVENSQYEDPSTSTFFMRTRFTVDSTSSDGDTLSDDFSTSVAREFAMSFRMTDPTKPMKLLIMVSKFGHCLNDLLYRVSAGESSAQVVAVVSNHPDLAHIADSYDIPFHHVPVGAGTKSSSEQKLLALIDELGVELVILARYMQVLSSNLCKKLDGRAINIHHSMLPSFKGARPYHQAYERGVKLVGATAHYVTENLDEGPIIEQEVTRIDHSLSAEEVTALGRNNESAALSRAVRWHVENRVLLHGHRTVILR